jgi:hypothetical protein
MYLSQLPQGVNVSLLQQSGQSLTGDEGQHVQAEIKHRNILVVDNQLLLGHPSLRPDHGFELEI